MDHVYGSSTELRITEEFDSMLGVANQEEIEEEEEEVTFFQDILESASATRWKTN